MNNTDYLLTVAPVKRWGILGSKCQFAKLMGESKDLSGCDKGHIEMDRGPSQVFGGVQRLVSTMTAKAQWCLRGANGSPCSLIPHNSYCKNPVPSMPMVTPVQITTESQNWTDNRGGRIWAGLMNRVFFDFVRAAGGRDGTVMHFESRMNEPLL